MVKCRYVNGSVVNVIVILVYNFEISSPKPRGIDSAIGVL